MCTRTTHACLLILLAVIGCSEKNDAPRFHFVPSSHSGIQFRNMLKETVEFNIFNYMYFYNGAGVGVGDFNGDELPDLYFTANQQLNKLYLNQGSLKFKDITVEAGVEGFNGWATGVSVADVNNDGRLDIYVGYIGDYLIFKGKNQLFINEGNNSEGIPQFTDRAMEFGLDLVGFSTQATFLDVDKDGDLDMFMLNHSLHENGTFGTSQKLRYGSHPLAGDKLLRNDGGFFVDVTKTSGILGSAIGYGLGVVVSDVNMDGWPDIYVGNDFHENDYLYINQKNGTFIESLEKNMNHTSRYTMGVDFADFNNDLFPDLLTTDMLPADQFIRKASAAEDPYDVFDFKLRFGYNHQYTRNSLQLNNQDGSFSEIALFAGIAATDWSWSALFTDMDLDGFKDIFITNGIFRRSNDLDYINYISADTIQMSLQHEMQEKHLRLIEKMPQIKLANFAFGNKGDLTFENKTKEWGLTEISYSNGGTFADLDNDGDPDLITNNVKDEAFLIENRSIEQKVRHDSTNHFLRIKLKGNAGNHFGLGAKVIVFANGRQQLQECQPVRGYQSSGDHRLIFGVGNQTKIDSLWVIWPDDHFQSIHKLDVDRQIELHQKDATRKFDYSYFHQHTTLFRETTSDLGINFRHKENKFVEFTREALLPHMLSAEGPAAAVGDVNGDGLEDVFFGGAKWQTAGLFLQQPTGKFIVSKQQAFKSDSTKENVDAVFFDMDGDNDNDLLVVNGGNEFMEPSAFVKPSLYRNDGKGNFSAADGLPEMFITASSVSVADFDNDKDIDVFIGVRAIPYQYGIEPANFLLENDGQGNFTNVTSTKAPILSRFGFITHSIWTDIDNDQDSDLLLAAEWKPLVILLNENGKFKPLLDSTFENFYGWWNDLNAADFDKDGDMDFIAGNLGLNSMLKASSKTPVKMYVSDFDSNGSTEQILTHVINGKEYPFYTRDEMVKQIPSLKKKFLSFSAYASATINEIFDAQTLSRAAVFQANYFESVYIENLGNLKFRLIPLPKAVQFSTLNSSAIDDFNQDGKLDVLVGGNFYPVNIQMGRYDASFGSLLLGNGHGGFSAMPNIQSGLNIHGEVRRIRKVVVDR